MTAEAPADLIPESLWPTVPEAARRFGDEADVDIGSLTATQTYLNPDKVNEYAAKPGGPVIVIRQGGKNYVGDGHHRVEAEKLRGRTSVRASAVP